MDGVETRLLCELYIDKSIDPRSTKRSLEKIEEYAREEVLDLLPPIDIDQRNRILDGIHRYCAHKLAGRDEIKVKVFTYEKEVDAVKHAYRANYKHGIQLNESDIIQTCIRFCEFGYTNEQIANIIEVRSKYSVGRYVKETRKRRENELATEVGELYVKGDENGKRVYTHKKLAEKIGQSTHRVSDLLDRYYAMQIRDLQTVRHKNAEPLYTHAELAKQFVVTKRLIERAHEKHCDIIFPPEQEQEVEAGSTLEPEAQGNVEADVDAYDDPADNNAKAPHRKWKSWKIQSMLLWLGNEMGLDLWVAADDKNGRYEDIVFSEIPRMRAALPAQKYENVRGVIELIDVMWLEGDDIVAAFEVEESTKIYSGLLRLSDLRLARPTPISLSVVAKPNDKKNVKTQIDRPTFKKAELVSHCTFIAYDMLEKSFNATKSGGSLPSSWRAFLDEIAEQL